MQVVLLGLFFTACLAVGPQPCCIMETYSAVLMSLSGSMTVGSTRGRMADVSIFTYLLVVEIAVRHLPLRSVQ